MKVKTPYSGTEVEFHVAANDRQCEEYLFLDRPTKNEDINALKECYVPILPGQNISIFGYLSGRVAHARFDVLMDGSFAGTRLVEPGKGGAVKTHNKRRIDFRTFQTVMEHDGDASNLEVVDLTLGTQSLQAKRDLGELDSAAHAFGVGSIVVLVSLREEGDPVETYIPDMREIPDCTFFGWMHRSDAIYNPGIEPTDSLVPHDITYGMPAQKANAFRTHYNDDRFGSKPFAKLVFYYRSKGAIINAGCMPLPQKGYPVEQAWTEPTPIRSPPSKPVEMSDDAMFRNGQHAPKKTLGGTLILPTSGKPQTLQQLADRLQAEREARRLDDDSVVQRSIHQDTISTRMAEPSTLVRSTLPNLPSRQELEEIIPADGILLHSLMGLVYPDMVPGDESRHRAASRLIHTLKGIAVLKRDDRGYQIVVRTDQPEL